MDIKDLIEIISDFIDLFLSGFIFMSLYNWINSKKTDMALMTVWSLIISILIKAFYSTVYSLLCPGLLISDAIRVMILSALGVIFAFIASFIRNCGFISSLLYATNHKSINDDVLRDVIDHKLRTMMSVYIKSSDVYYIGRLYAREEKGLDSWIVLTHYACVDKKTNKVIFTSDPKDEEEIPSSVLINLSNVEYMELTYEKESNVWKKLK